MKLANGTEHDDDEFEKADEYELNNLSSFSLFELSSFCLLFAIAIARAGDGVATEAEAIVAAIVDVGVVARGVCSNRLLLLLFMLRDWFRLWSICWLDSESKSEMYFAFFFALLAGLMLMPFCVVKL